MKRIAALLTALAFTASCATTGAPQREPTGKRLDNAPEFELLLAVQLFGPEIKGIYFVRDLQKKQFSVAECRSEGSDRVLAAPVCELLQDVWLPETEMHKQAFDQALTESLEQEKQFVELGLYKSALVFGAGVVLGTTGLGLGVKQELGSRGMPKTGAVALVSMIGMGVVAAYYLVTGAAIGYERNIEKIIQTAKRSGKGSDKDSKKLWVSETSRIMYEKLKLSFKYAMLARPTT
jgi:hypothetical protein